MVHKRSSFVHLVVVKIACTNDEITISIAIHVPGAGDCTSELCVLLIAFYDFVSSNIDPVLAATIYIYRSLVVQAHHQSNRLRRRYRHTRHRPHLRLWIQTCPKRESAWVISIICGCAAVTGVEFIEPLNTNAAPSFVLFWLKSYKSRTDHNVARPIRIDVPCTSYRRSRNIASAWFCSRISVLLTS
jgi:hypothetical protein